jgi:hypothetical protein
MGTLDRKHWTNGLFVAYGLLCAPVLGTLLGQLVFGSVSLLGFAGICLASAVSFLAGAGTITTRRDNIPIDSRRWVGAPADCRMFMACSLADDRSCDHRLDNPGRSLDRRERANRLRWCHKSRCDVNVRAGHHDHVASRHFGWRRGSTASWRRATMVAQARGLRTSQTRRFPPPWSVEWSDACFIVRDHGRQALAYVYYEQEPGRRAATRSRIWVMAHHRANAARSQGHARRLQGFANWHTAPLGG